MAGSQWFISNDAPGTSVEGAVNGDFILYSSGDVYTVQNGTPVATGINIVGEQGYSPSISVKVDTDTEYVLTV